MNINMDERNGVIIVFIKEERLDAHNSNDLKSAIKDLFESGEEKYPGRLAGRPFYRQFRTWSTRLRIQECNYPTGGVEIINSSASSEINV